MLDAVAIAAQVLVGRMLGAGDVEGAVAAGRRVIGWSLASSLLVGLVLFLGRDLLPHAFTDDPAVIERAEALWPLFIVMQPLSGVVFALDGILIGAGDTRYLALVHARRRAADLRADRAARARGGLGRPRCVARPARASCSCASPRS